MSQPARSLRSQIVLSFVGFATAISLFFALSSFVVAYSVEDSIFEDMIAQEAARQTAHWHRDRRLMPTGADWISVHSDTTTFPKDLLEQFRRQGPREEYSGADGRHYHVSALPLDGRPPAYVVAEVGSRLAVRPLRGELLTAVALLTGIVLLIAASLGYWLAYRATAPLSRLVERVSAGQPGKVPHISAGDFPDNEIGLLASTLEAMLTRTRAFIEREIRFTSDASHELRTPIAVIRSSAELVESQDKLPASVANPLRRIREAARQMEQSVDLLLLLGREQRVQSAREEVLLLPLVENVVLAETVRLDAASFDVSIEIPENCSALVNERVAETILGNLVANVFTHAAPGKLRIYVEGTDLLVSDRGPGIAPNMLSPFSEEDPGQAGQSAAGLGLSIVARLCKLHDIPFALNLAPGGGTAARIGLLRVPKN